jgi:DNA-binding XRE family transcriptional regulator
MNAIEQIERILSETLPGARFSLDKPKQPTGPWWLDAVLGEHSVTVEWRPRRGFGISSGSSESSGYGEGPDEVVEDAALALARIILLLKTGEKTESPHDVELRRLREEKEISQEELARVLQMSQPAISKMERRGDMSISTLRKIVAALGGELELVARFPDHTARILRLGEGETA